MGFAGAATAALVFAALGCNGSGGSSSQGGGLSTAPSTTNNNTTATPTSGSTGSTTSGSTGATRGSTNPISGGTTRPITVVPAGTGGGTTTGGTTTGGTTTGGTTTGGTTTGGTTTTPSAGFAPAADMAYPRGLHTATLLDDGRVLIVGGIDANPQGASFIPFNEVYDPTANTFTNTADPSLGGNPGGFMVIADPQGKSWAVPRMLHTATKLQDGTVFITGGFGMETWDQQGAPQQTELTSSFIFDPTTNTFSFVGQLNYARSEHYAVLLDSGLVMIAGGYNSQAYNGLGGTLPVVEFFDPTGQPGQQFGVLSQTGDDMLYPRQNGGAVPIPGSGTAIFVGGSMFAMLQGQTTVGHYLAPGAELLDLSAQPPAFAAAIAPANDRTFCSLDLNETGTSMQVAGGYDANGAVLTVEKLDLATTGTPQWTTSATLQQAHIHHASAALGDDLLLVGGVDLGATSGVTTLQVADFVHSAGVVEQFQMAQDRNGCTATTLQNGQVLVTGGFSGGTKSIYGMDGTSVGTAELFTKP